MIAEGFPAMVRAVNSIGLQRRGVSDEDVQAIKFAYRKLFLHKGCNIHEGMESILADEQYGKNTMVNNLIRFLKESERGFLH